MQIREPKFKFGEKVYCEEFKCNAIIIGISDYSFANDKYYYSIRYDDGDNEEMIESMLRPCQEPPKTVWELQNGDTYYVISGYGEVLETTWKYNIDSNSRKIGNAFLTKEEAEFEVERRKVETEMLRLGGRRKFKFNGDNYGIYFCEGASNVVLCHCTLYQGLIYFDSIEATDNAIKTIGEDRLRKYIFGVDS